MYTVWLSRSIKNCSAAYFNCILKQEILIPTELNSIND